MDKNIFFKTSSKELSKTDYKEVSRRYLYFTLTFIAILCSNMLITPDIAFAANVGKEFAGALEKIINIITGPVGQMIAIGGMAIAGITFIFNRQDMGEGFKTMLSVVFGICFIAFGSSIVYGIWSKKTALI